MQSMCKNTGQDHENGLVENIHEYLRGWICNALMLRGCDGLRNVDEFCSADRVHRQEAISEPQNTGRQLAICRDQSIEGL